MKRCIQKGTLAAPSRACYLAMFLLVNLLASLAAHGTVRYQVIKSFGSITNDGQGQWAGLIEGSDGALYGTTPYGGSNDCGTAFKLLKDGSGYTVLHHFFSTNDIYGRNADGRHPWGRLVEGGDGMLYGTALEGGTYGRGTIFTLSKDGTGFRVLHNNRGFTDLDQAFALMEGSDGALYGLAFDKIFKMNKDGSGLIRATADASGSPESQLREGSDGRIYGAALSSHGGADCIPAGSVFARNKDFSYYGGHGFWICLEGISEEGIRPKGGILEGSDGRLYGTTSLGGPHLGGTLFSLRKDGSDFTVLHAFGAVPDDGWDSTGQLVEGPEGSLFGTTGSGGSHGGGTAFRLNKDGTGYRILHHFAAPFASAPGDGAVAAAGLLRGSDGSLYGTTRGGGEFGFGTVFKLWPPPRLLPPVVSNGAITLRILDGPGLTNEIQRATTLDGGWLALTNLVVPASGVAEFTDIAPPPPSAFYRVVAP